MEYQKGRGGGLCLIGSHPSWDEDLDEPFMINEELVEMIADKEQADGVEIIHQTKRPLV